MSETQTDDVVIVDPEDDAAPAPETAAPAPKPDATGEEDAAYGRKVQKRIAAVTAQRRAVEAENERLRGMLAREQARATAAEAEAAKRDIQSAREAVRKAAADGDADAQAEAAVRLADASARSHVAQQQPVQQAPQAPQHTPRTRQWLDENPWFQSDPHAQSAAMAADRAARARGLEVDSEEFWQFIEKRVAKHFPHHFDAEDDEEDDAPPAPPARRPTAGVAPVAPARRTVVAPAQSLSRLPSLTKDEVDIAKGMGLTAKEYAEEKLRILQAEGKAA